MFGQQQPAQQPAQVPQQAPMQQQAPWQPYTPPADISQQYQAPVQRPAEGTQYVVDKNGQLQQVVAQPAADKAEPKQPDVPVSADFIGQVESFLRTAGISREQVEQEYEALGELSVGTKKALRERHGAATAKLIEGQVQVAAQHIMAQEAQREKMAHQMVEEAFKGTTNQTGEQSWMELLTWARTNIPAETRKELNRMLEGGEFSAKQAISYMINQLKEKQGVAQSGQFMNGDGAQGLGSVGANDLTAKAYSRELEQVVAKYGYDSIQRKQLDDRRMRSAKLGY